MHQVIDNLNVIIESITFYIVICDLILFYFNKNYITEIANSSTITCKIYIIPNLPLILLKNLQEHKSLS